MTPGQRAARAEQIRVNTSMAAILALVACVVAGLGVALVACGLLWPLVGGLAAAGIGIIAALLLGGGVFLLVCLRLDAMRDREIAALDKDGGK